MKGISKILSASTILMGFGRIYSSAQEICSGAGGGAGTSMEQQGYVLVPQNPSSLANCYSNSSYSPSTQSQQMTPVQPVIPMQVSPVQSQQSTDSSPIGSEVGTCTVTTLKHCDNPPEEVQPPSTTTQTVVSVPPQQPPTVIVVTPTEQPKTVMVQPPQPPRPPIVPMIPVQTQQPVVPMIPVQTQQPMVPMQPRSVVPVQVQRLQPGQMGQQGQPGQMGQQGQPGQMGQQGQPGQMGQQGQPGQMGQQGQPGQMGQQGGQCFCTVPQQPQASQPNPMPMSPTPINISSNGYPLGSTAGYNSSLGQLPPCMDSKPPQGGSCEMQQSSFNDCTSQTPTVVVNGMEYLIGPSLYSELTQPCSNPCPCPA